MEFTINLMNGEKKSVRQSLSGKILETENMQIILQVDGKHPVWNLQEAGLPWPKYLQESRNTLLSGTPATLESIKRK
jgi:hypothetical protein